MLEASRNPGNGKIGHGNSANRKRRAEIWVTYLDFAVSPFECSGTRIKSPKKERPNRKKRRTMFLCLPRREAECEI